MTESTAFRAPLALRWLLGVLGILSGCGAARAVWLAAARSEPRLLVAAAVLLAPVLVAGSALRFRWEVRPEGLRVTTLRSARAFAWSQVRNLDRLRVSFVLETDAGPLRPLWLGRGDREEALRAIVRQGGLTPVAGDLPWGVRARFVPRSGIISVSHVQRRERRQG